MIRTLQFHSFKAFRSFQVAFSGSALLVGPNNAGKSTIISVLRAAAQMLRAAAVSPQPDIVGTLKGVSYQGYGFPGHSFGLVTENVRHEFADDETTVRIAFDGGSQITMVWPGSSSADPDALDKAPFYFLTTAKGLRPRTRREIIDQYPLLGAIPSISPVEASEGVRDEKYVLQQVNGRLASRHFRNQLMLLTKQPSQTHENRYTEFCEFCKVWLPEISLQEVRTRPGRINEECDVFYLEPPSRVPKELTWAGDGVQVFLQLLYHVHRLRDADSLILDEPDIYLHPDLQRRVVQVLAATKLQTITATHSAELLAEAETSEVVWIDKSQRFAVRAKPELMEGVSHAIGSSFNLRLSRALRARAVLFVEGEDMKILRMLADRVGCPQVAREADLAVIPIGGFSQWANTTSFAWLSGEFLQKSIPIHLILDRDYRTELEMAEIVRTLAAAGVTAHVWGRKELESYLLEERLLARASGLSQQEMAQLMQTAAGAVIPDLVANIIQHRIKGARRDRTQEVAAVKESLTEVEHLKRAGLLLSHVPAKEFLKALNRGLTDAGYKPLTFRRLATECLVEDLDEEVATVLRTVERSLQPRR